MPSIFARLAPNHVVNHRSNLRRLAKPIEHYHVELCKALLEIKKPVTSHAVIELIQQLESKLLYPTLDVMCEEDGLRRGEEWHDIARTYYHGMTRAFQNLLEHDNTVLFTVILDFMEAVQENRAFRQFLKKCQNVLKVREKNVPQVEPVALNDILPFVAAWPKGALARLQASTNQLTAVDSLRFLTLVLRDVKYFQTNYELLVNATPFLTFEGITSEQCHDMLKECQRTHANVLLDSFYSLAEWLDTLCSRKPELSKLLPPAEDLVYYFLHEITFWGGANNSIIKTNAEAINPANKWSMLKKYLQQLEQARKSESLNYPIEVEGCEIDIETLATHLMKLFVLPISSQLSPLIQAEIVNFWCAHKWGENPRNEEVINTFFAYFLNQDNREENLNNLLTFLANISEAAAPLVISKLNQCWEFLDVPATICTLVNNIFLMQALKEDWLFAKLRDSLNNLSLSQLQDVIQGVCTGALPIFDKILQTRPSVINQIKANRALVCVCLGRGLLWQALFNAQPIFIEQSLMIYDALQAESTNEKIMAEITEKIADNIAALCRGDNNALVASARIQMNLLLHSIANRDLPISPALWHAVMPALQKPRAMQSLLGLGQQVDVARLQPVPKILEAILADPIISMMLIVDLRQHLTRDNVAWLMQHVPAETLSLWIKKIPELGVAIRQDADLIKLVMQSQVSLSFRQELLVHTHILQMDEWCMLLPHITLPTELRQLLLTKLKNQAKYISHTILVRTLIQNPHEDFVLAVFERLNNIDAMRSLFENLQPLTLEQRYEFLVSLHKSAKFKSVVYTFWSSLDLPILSLLRGATEEMIERHLLEDYLLPAVLCCHAEHPNLKAPERLVMQFPMHAVMIRVFNHPHFKNAISKNIWIELLKQPAGPKGLDQVGERQLALADPALTANLSLDDWVSLLDHTEITLGKLLYALAEHCVQFPAKQVMAVYERLRVERRQWLIAAVLAKWYAVGKTAKQSSEENLYRLFLERTLTQEISVTLFGCYDIPLSTFKNLHDFACAAKWSDEDYILAVLTAMDKAPLERVMIILSVPEDITLTEIYDAASKIENAALRHRLLTEIACSVAVSNKLATLQPKRTNPFNPREIVLTQIAKCAGFPDATTQQPSPHYPVTDSRFCETLASAVASQHPLSTREMEAWLRAATDPLPPIFKKLQPALTTTPASEFLALLVHCPRLSNAMMIEIMRILVNDKHIKIDMPSLISQVRGMRHAENLLPNQIGLRLARAKHIYQLHEKMTPDEALIKGLDEVRAYQRFAQILNDINPDTLVVDPAYCYADGQEAYVPNEWFLQLEQKKAQIRAEQRLMRIDACLVMSETHIINSDGALRLLPSLKLPEPEHQLEP